MSQRIFYNKDGSLVLTGGDINNVGVTTPDVAANINGDPSRSQYGIYSNYGLVIVIGFPDVLNIEKVGIRASQIAPHQLWVSTDSTNGMNGEWIQYGSITSEANNYVEIDFVHSVKWIRLVWTQYWHTVYSFVVIGEYAAPRFKVYNTNEIDALTGAYPIVLENAPNHIPYSDYESFKIKNLDTVQHTYFVDIEKVFAGTDTLIDNCFKLAYDAAGTGDWSSPSKVNTLTLVDIQPGEFTNEIRVYADISEVQNPANGIHYFVTKVAETA